MMYQTYQAQSDLLAPLRAMASVGQQWFDDLSKIGAGTAGGILSKHMAAGCEMITRAGLSHHRPAFGITEVCVAGQPVPVYEEVVARTPFATLLHFRRTSDTV